MSSVHHGQRLYFFVFHISVYWKCVMQLQFLRRYCIQYHRHCIMLNIFRTTSNIHQYQFLSFLFLIIIILFFFFGFFTSFFKYLFPSGPLLRRFNEHTGLGSSSHMSARESFVANFANPIQHDSQPRELISIN